MNIFDITFLHCWDSDFYEGILAGFFCEGTFLKHRKFHYTIILFRNSVGSEYVHLLDYLKIQRS